MEVSDAFQVCFYVLRLFLVRIEQTHSLGVTGKSKFES